MSKADIIDYLEKRKGEWVSSNEIAKEINKASIKGSLTKLFKSDLEIKMNNLERKSEKLGITNLYFYRIRE